MQHLRLFSEWIKSKDIINEITRDCLQELFFNWACSVEKLVPSVVHNIFNRCFEDFWVFVVAQRELFIWNEIQFVELVTWIEWFQDFLSTYDFGDCNADVLSRIRIVTAARHVPIGGVKLDDFAQNDIDQDRLY